MSINTLKKLLAHYAPATVGTQIDQIEAAAALERNARDEKVHRENELLEQIARESGERQTPGLCLA